MNQAIFKILLVGAVSAPSLRARPMPDYDVAYVSKAQRCRELFANNKSPELLCPARLLFVARRCMWV
jgi:hypothetical protein